MGLIRRLFAQDSMARGSVKWRESWHFPAPSSVGVFGVLFAHGVECFGRAVAPGARPILAGTESSFMGQPWWVSPSRLSFLLF